MTGRKRRLQHLYYFVLVQLMTVAPFKNQQKPHKTNKQTHFYSSGSPVLAWRQEEDLFAEENTGTSTIII